jgi:hypothetical protein
MLCTAGGLLSTPLLTEVGVAQYASRLEELLHDDSTLGGLAEDLGQTHDRHGTRRDDVRQHLHRPDRGELIDIANQQQRSSLRQGRQDSAHEWDIDHRGLVDDQQIAVERCVLVAPEAAGEN